MKTYEITIRPLSGFGTPLKGDTLFGHICWQAVYDESLFGKSIDKLLADYEGNPFIVVSSAYPKLGNHYALKRPDLPLDSLFDFEGMGKPDIIGKRKEYKSRKWMLIEQCHRINSIKSNDLYKSDKELFNLLKESYPDDSQREFRKKGITSYTIDFSQPHNTINRLTGTTGEGGFAPFAVDQKVYLPQSELSVFVGIADGIDNAQVKKAFQQIGDYGFGKDASTGLGKFKVGNIAEIDLTALGSDKPNACYTLSPSVPNKGMFSKMFFSPFTRFGRHGDVLAKSKNPFKNPVIMADEGGVFVFVPKERDLLRRSYIGRAIKNVSLTETNAVVQGYSLYIPVSVEV